MTKEIELKTKTCCFYGGEIYKSKKSDVSCKLKKQIEKLINSGITIFNVGADRNFDLMAAVHIIRLKNVYPSIRLNLIVPSLSKMNESENGFLQNFIFFNADTLSVVSGMYDENCKHEAEKRLSKNAGYCVVYSTAVDSIREKGMTIIDIS
ncbi:MAG: hypothetical protein BGN88_00305 [Clostridiales bacterium 43-6]|nr:MAG: hypothetical protein BGN88_00305 [Clostridiales bacterium 43-6]